MGPGAIERDAVRLSQTALILLLCVRLNNWQHRFDFQTAVLAVPVRVNGLRPPQPNNIEAVRVDQSRPLPPAYAVAARAD